MSDDASREAPELARIGAMLRRAGLTARALAAWAGTARIAALSSRLDALAASPITPAAALLALFVGGRELAIDQLRAVPLHEPPDARDRSDEGHPASTDASAPTRSGAADGAGLRRRLPASDLIEALVAHGLVARDGDRLRAQVALVPLGQGLLACDRLDAPVEHDLVCWPDDSSHHLAAAIPPGRRATWLDLGCGSAFAPIARPDLATQITGVDINPRAVHHARLGAAVSGIRHVAVSLDDVGAAHAPADLVTCNAPIPDPPGAERFPGAAIAEVWRRAEPSLFDRLWPALRRAVRPGGLIVVHAAREAALSGLAGAGGERVIVTYTPDGVRGFAVAWWRPDAPDRLVTAHRALTADRPHLDARDRDDALAG